jgi:hypothetical protein
MKRMWHGARAGMLMLSLTLVGCASWPGPQCSAGLQRAKIAQLFFGRSIPTGGSVDDAAWADFVNRDVASRFPDGFTVMDSAGAWRDSAGRTVRERGKVLTIVLTDAKGARAKLDAVRAAYKTRFHQDAVLLVESRGCAGF